MNSIDLLKYKQFPMSVETLAFMQNMLALTARLASIGGSTYIVDGCVEQGSNVSAGVVVINGEILPFEGGAKIDTIVIQENKESVQVYDERYTDIYSLRKAIFGSGSGQLPWSSFVRLPKPTDLADGLSKLTKSFEEHNHASSDIEDFSSSIYTEMQKAFPSGMVNADGSKREHFLNIICAGEVSSDGTRINCWGENKIDGFPFKSELNGREYITVTHNYGNTNYAVLPVLENVDGGLAFDFMGGPVSVAMKTDNAFVLVGGILESWRDSAISFIMFKLRG